VEGPSLRKRTIRKENTDKIPVVSTQKCRFYSDTGTDRRFIACDHVMQGGMAAISPPRQMYCTRQSGGLTRGGNTACNTSVSAYLISAGPCWIRGLLQRLPRPITVGACNHRASCSQTVGRHARHRKCRRSHRAYAAPQQRRISIMTTANATRDVMHYNSSRHKLQRWGNMSKSRPKPQGEAALTPAERQARYRAA